MWLVRLPLVLTIGIWIQCPFALSFKVPFSASSLIQFLISIISLPGEDSMFPKRCNRSGG